MMTLAHRYQEFGSQDGYSQSDASHYEHDLEEEKLRSFEAGYQAGWEDSVKAQGDDKQNIASDFARNLQEVSFSYHEARSALTQSLRPLFEEILNKLLPEIAYSNIGPHVVEQLGNMVRDQSDQLIEIIVSPQNHQPLQDLLGSQISDPFVLLSQPELGEGQVFLRIGSVEREINLDDVIDNIRHSTATLFEQELSDE